MGERYYVIQTHHRAEALAHANLQTQNFDVFLPTLNNERRLRGLLVQAQEPLFPSYMFVRLDLTHASWRRVSSTRGVRSILGSSPEAPTPVPGGVVEHIRESCAAGKFTPDPARYTVNAGDMVRILGGTFDGHIVKCIESRAHRVKLLIKLLGKVFEMYFPSEMVVRA